jgi:hypothetical protein
MPRGNGKKGQKMMYHLLDDFSISPLLRAMEANVYEAWTRLDRRLGAVVHDEPELLCFISGLPFHLSNGIVRAHFPSDTVEETLEERLTQLRV